MGAGAEGPGPSSTAIPGALSGKWIGSEQLGFNLVSTKDAGILVGESNYAAYYNHNRTIATF